MMILLSGYFSTVILQNLLIKYGLYSKAIYKCAPDEVSRSNIFVGSR